MVKGSFRFAWFDGARLVESFILRTLLLAQLEGFFADELPGEVVQLEHQVDLLLHLLVVAVCEIGLEISVFITVFATTLFLILSGFFISVKLLRSLNDRGTETSEVVQREKDIVHVESLLLDQTACLLLIVIVCKVALLFIERLLFVFVDRVENLVIELGLGP